jgi:hypothetical protein
MNKFSILSLVFFLLSFTLLFADYAITQGPDIGEIYFIGPTVTGEGIYRSTDFGETAVCMDSSYYYNQIESICADLTPGSIYSIRQYDVLYYSNNYGQAGSWVFRNYPIRDVSSGRNEGVLYNKCSSHSNDYGINFIQHLLNGYFGSLKASGIDNEDNVGYAITFDNEPDSVYLLISYDNFENMQTQYVFDMHWSTELHLNRGYENGELYLFTSNTQFLDNRLYYSTDYGQTWELKNTFNCPNLPMRGIVGGRQTGELYIIFECIQFAFLINHIYIYHSLDYGETFTVYHPVDIGPEPNYANFEANSTSGTAPLTVQFTDLSSGQDIISWEWDFDNDGIIDSYEQHPEYTYQDTGSYTVRLTIFYGNPNTVYKEDYIHVSEGNIAENYEISISKYRLMNYPNPFNPSTIINYELPINTEKANIEIYNIKGQKVYSRVNQPASGSIVWKCEDQKSGIYLIKISNSKQKYVKKITYLK